MRRRPYVAARRKAGALDEAGVARELRARFPGLTMVLATGYSLSVAEGLDLGAPP